MTETSIDVLVSVLAALAILIGCVGIVIPILPGSILIFIAAIVWAIFIGGTVGWVSFAIIAVFCAIGMASSWVLTGRRLKDRDIPNSTLMWGGVAAIVGFFVVPIVGLLLGFVAGLYLAEYSRLKDSKAAWESSWTAIKAAGIGILIEFICAALSATTFAVALFIHFG